MFQRTVTFNNKASQPNCGHVSLPQWLILLGVIWMRNDWKASMKGYYSYSTFGFCVPTSLKQCKNVSPKPAVHWSK